MLGLSSLEKLRAEPSMRKEILTSSLASCYIWLAGTAVASVAVKSGPLITSLESVILPVDFATVITGSRRAYSLWGT